MSVRPFTIDTPQPVIDRIRAKLADSTVGYAPDDDTEWRYGMDARYLSELRDYWLEGYDWRAEEAKLNAFPQYKARVGDRDVHFYWLRGNGRRGFPILLTHGWPGSVVEFLEAMPLLAASGFDLVIPSLPGYGWSDRPARPIGPRAVATTWRTLMTEVLGYDRFGAQGGDWGSAVTAWLGSEHADVVVGAHLNFFMALPPSADSAEDTIAYWGEVGKLQAAEGAYMFEHMTKPQTIGLALHDHPLGWAAWVIEKFQGWGHTLGNIEGSFTKDQLITNLMTYLVTDTVQSSIWLYHGSTLETRYRGPVTVPTGLALFPGESYPYPSRAAAERAHDVRRWTVMDKGGHFAAMESPGPFSDDVIAFFDSLDGS